MTSLAPAVPALAAIDMGSNSFRLEVAHLSAGQYRRRLYLKESVRLGAGLDADSSLTEEAMQRGLTCLHKFSMHCAASRPSACARSPRRRCARRAIAMNS